MAERSIGDELDRQKPAVEKLIAEMQLNCDYKDVTFEVLNDEDFIKVNEEKYPCNRFAKLYSNKKLWDSGRSLFEARSHNTAAPFETALQQSNQDGQSYCSTKLLNNRFACSEFSGECSASSIDSPRMS